MYHHHNTRAENGFLLLVLGLLFGYPIFCYIGLFQMITAPVALMATTAAAATTAGSIVLGLGMGVFALYGIIGIGYSITTAIECYKTEHGLLDVFKSHILNKEGLSFNGIVQAISAIAWSPFILLGGLYGITAKAIAHRFWGTTGGKISCSDRESSYSSEAGDIPDCTQRSSSSYKVLVDNLGVTAAQNQAQNPVADARPSKLFASPAKISPTHDAGLAQSLSF